MQNSAVFYTKAAVLLVVNKRFVMDKPDICCDVNNLLDTCFTFLLISQSVIFTKKLF